MKRKISAIILLVIMALALTACSQSDQSGVDYSDAENWAYLQTEEEGRADVFFIAPTVYSGSEDSFNMAMDDDETKASFLGATNMEKGIYDEDNRFFAPYYRQAGLNVYELSEEEREPYLDAAYEDVKEAFLYYLENYNDGQPVVLAGFSQGADLSIRLLEDCFEDEDINDLLVACYAVGWRVSEEQLEEYPHLRFASGEDDTGVIIAFNSEAEDIDDSLIIPAGTRTLAINPLNWKTDGTPASADENLGACFTDYDGNIVSEIPHLTGAYIDSERGALKVTDISPEEYPAGLSIFEDGVYHLYDYQFFYRNLQENVKTRIDAYLKASARSDGDRESGDDNPAEADDSRDSAESGSSGSGSDTAEAGSAGQSGQPAAGGGQVSIGDHEHIWVDHVATKQTWVSNWVTVPVYDTKTIRGAQFYTRHSDGSFISDGPVYWFENGFTMDDLEEIIANGLRNADENGLYNGVYYGNYVNRTKTEKTQTGTKKEDQGYYETEEYVDYRFCLLCGKRK